MREREGVEGNEGGKILEGTCMGDHNTKKVVLVDGLNRPLGLFRIGYGLLYL